MKGGLAGLGLNYPLSLSTRVRVVGTRGTWKMEGAWYRVSPAMPIYAAGSNCQTVLTKRDEMDISSRRPVMPAVVPSQDVKGSKFGHL